ncbi:hypothetical protein SAMN04488092_10356 [Thalassovita taeanensis]|uniref:Uncharacterized protein n=2 Tax=Thalassovita taeanensis TaxID=657014 RepID=A0A1H9C0A5_9RHOB|nr:hypothetical protein SAMN04488092_10356 [Thalassovita taeanensis]
MFQYDSPATASDAAFALLGRSKKSYRFHPAFKAVLEAGNTKQQALEGVISIAAQTRSNFTSAPGHTKLNDPVRGPLPRHRRADYPPERNSHTHISY